MVIQHLPSFSLLFCLGWWTSKDYVTRLSAALGQVLSVKGSDVIGKSRHWLSSAIWCIRSYFLCTFCNFTRSQFVILWTYARILTPHTHIYILCIWIMQLFIIFSLSAVVIYFYFSLLTRLSICIVKANLGIIQAIFLKRSRK